MALCGRVARRRWGLFMGHDSLQEEVIRDGSPVPTGSTT